MKNQMKKKGKGKNLFGIKQGAGAVNACPFPGSKKKKSKGGGPNGSLGWMKHALNAMHPSHLALPRAVGGYSVIRTTDIHTISEPFALFGLFKGPRIQFTETCWGTATGVVPGQPGYGKPIRDEDNATFLLSTPLRSTALDGTTMVPAAITVQIMNGNALQTTSGMTFIGRSKTVLDLMGDYRTWQEVADGLINYSAPRLCSAGKLALSGARGPVRGLRPNSHIPAARLARRPRVVPRALRGVGARRGSRAPGPSGHHALLQSVPSRLQHGWGAGTHFWTRGI